jgi:hypothetical protein
MTRIAAKEEHHAGIVWGAELLVDGQARGVAVEARLSAR